MTNKDIKKNGHKLHKMFCLSETKWKMFMLCHNTTMMKPSTHYFLTFYLLIFSPQISSSAFSTQHIEEILNCCLVYSTLLCAVSVTWLTEESAFFGENFTLQRCYNQIILSGKVQYFGKKVKKNPNPYNSRTFLAPKFS